MTDLTINVQSGELIASLNISTIMKAMTTLSLLKIRTDQDRVPPDEDRELSQLLGLARVEDQEDGVG